MIVEIKGIGIPNKGAELMLAAVMEKISERYQNVKFAVDPTTSFEGRCRFGLLQKGWLSIKGLQLSPFFELAPQRLLARFGIVKNSQVDVIIDASGFCYSDSFGYENAYAQVGKYAQRWKAQGKKLVFMPQAYGPFEEERLAQSMRTTLNAADVFFARDEVSKEYLSKIGLQDVTLSPDFTCLVKGIVPSAFNAEEAGDTCIILNNRMLEKLGKDQGELYLEGIRKSIERLRELNAKPYFLMHEGEDDVALTKKINSQLSQPLACYYFEDPTHIKGVIGTATRVVSARFHGLVSALSQGVPVVAMGWSHKYQMLLDDYHCGQYMIDHTDPDALVNAVETLCDEKEVNKITQQLLHTANEQKALTEDMWNRVFNVIDQHHHAVRKQD